MFSFSLLLGCHAVVYTRQVPVIELNNFAKDVELDVQRNGNGYRINVYSKPQVDGPSFATNQKTVGTNSEATLTISDSFLSTQGSKIIDSNGQEFVIAGVSWFGSELSGFSPGGLLKRSYKEIMNQMIENGFNSIRFPYSNTAIRTLTPKNISYELNPELSNKTVLQVWDTLFEYAGSVGLKIILDRHRPDPKDQSPLWYTEQVSEQVWIDDWKFLAKRYLNNPAVIGADLHNEPTGPACWGCEFKEYDWRAAAERCGNAIHSVNPNWLIFVEGVNWSTDITGAWDKPIKLDVPNKLVYSLHDYGITVAQKQPRFSDPQFPDNMPEFYNSSFGFLVERDVAPVWISEFGTSLKDPIDRKWLKALTLYIKQSGVSWTYWSWNPESNVTEGLLKDDWKTYRAEHDDYLNPIKHPISH